MDLYKELLDQVDVLMDWYFDEGAAFGIVEIDIDLRRAS